MAKGKLIRGARLTVGTEGTWENVMRIIGQAHAMLHKKGIVRIQTDIRVGSRYESTLEALNRGKLTGHRTDKKQKFSEKVTVVNDILAADAK